MNTQYKLSVTGKLAVVIGLAYAMPAFAANIEAVQGGATVSQQNGVDIVNIVKPNEQGLSHNQYDKYNVSKAGAVLNNALEAGTSKLAGQLNANQNFNGKAAEVILNEVVSKNPSLILGQQEVFGMAADYVLANPNGITYNGGDIINAPRASLVVGKPTIENGRLDSFNTHGHAALNVQGKVGGVSILDLVAPKVIVNAQAKVTAKDKINVVSGANKVGYANTQVEKLARTDNDAPILDGQIFGSMNAGAIRIHATDERATQTIQKAQLQATENLTTDVAGSLNIDAANLSAKDINLNANNTRIHGHVFDKHQPTASSDSGKMSGNIKFVEHSSATHQDFEGSTISATGALQLNNTGNLNINAATIHAGSLNIDAQNVVSDSTITKQTQSDYKRLSKGLWHNETTSASEQQTLHSTTINVDNDATIHAHDTLDLQATALTAGNNVKLVGSNAISLSGDATTNQSESGLDVKLESGKLKTGKAAKAELTQQYTATNIQAGGNLGLQTGGELAAIGAKMNANGSAIVDADTVKFGAATTQTSNAVHDKFKYWGGLAGGQEDGKTYTQEHLQASSLVAQGDLLIGAKNGVTLSGSTVKGGTDAKVNAGNGKLNIQHARTTSTESELHRKGTIFNITKSSASRNTEEEVVTGSRLESDTNLQVLSEQEVNVLGSSLQAAQNLGITTAGNLNIATATANSRSHEQSFGIKGFTEGNATASSTPDKKVAEATGGAGVRFTKTSKNTQTADQVGSSLSGDNVDLKTQQDINISGSNVNATNFVNLQAQNVNTTAAQDVTTTHETSRVTEVGIKATAGVSNFDPKVTTQVGVNSQYTDTTTTEGTAQVTNITGNNVNIRSDNAITHQGSNITANGDINQNAQTITHDVANNTSDVKKTQHAGGVFVGAEASSSKGLGVSAGIYGNGGNAQSSSNTTVSGSLNAGNSVNTQATTVKDVATNYDVGNDVNISANQYSNEAASSNSTYTAKQGGASLTVSAHTKDLNNINVNAGLKVNYEGLDTQASNATIGNMNAGNVNITANEDINVASNMTTTGNVSITSSQGNVAFTQSNNTSSSTATGVDVGLNVGAKVNVATGAVLPKGGAGVEVTHASGNNSTGVAGKVTTGGNVAVTANDSGSIAVNGASIISEGTVKLSAGEVSSSALQHTHDALKVAAGGQFSLGTGMVTETEQHTETHMVKDNYCAPPREVTTVVTTEKEKLAIDSASFGAHADVTKENGVSHTANEIVAKGTGQPQKTFVGGSEVAVTVTPPGGSNGSGLTINANNANGKGITLTGTNVLASDVNLTAQGGNVNLTSAEGSLKRTGGGAGLNLSGTVDQNGFKPTAGDAYVNVDLANNKTFTGSHVQANNVNITTPEDLNLNSSTITAQKVNANVGGDVSIVSQQNVVDETKVGLAAAGGKGIDPKSLTKTEEITTTKTYEQTICTACGPATQTVTVEEKTEVTKVDAGKVAGQVLSDLQNGTIMGVKAEAKIDVDVEKSKTSQAAGITANTLDVNATGGHVNLQGAQVQHENGSGFGDAAVTTANNQDNSKTFTLGVDVGTNVPKMVEYGIQHVTTGTSPLFNTSFSKGQTVVVASNTQTATPVEPAVETKPTDAGAYDPFTQSTIPANPINTGNTGSSDKE